jgi:hypothetical protein
MFDQEAQFEIVKKKLEPWFHDEITDLYSRAPGALPRRGQTEGLDTVLMGIPIWGRSWIERFTIWCLPSLGAPENIKALSGRTRMVIYRPPAAGPLVFRLTNWLRRNGIQMVYRDIPDWVMAEMTAAPLPADATPEQKAAHAEESEEKYELQFCMIGCMQNLLSHMAGHSGMGFHMLMPDHVYAKDYFPNMWRLAKEHDAITQAGMSVNLLTAGPEIDKWRNMDPRGGEIAIPDKAIGDICADHIHDESLSLFMNHGSFPASLPAGPRLIWQSDKGMHVYSCFHNPVWLAPHLMANSPVAFTSTMDCLMPEFIPPSETTGEPRIYTPKPSDGLAFMEVSMPGKRVPGRFVDANKYCEWMWNRVSFVRDYWPYFKRPMLLETTEPRSADVKGKPVLKAADVPKEFGQILQLLEDNRARLMDEFTTRKFGSRFAREQQLPMVAS